MPQTDVLIIGSGIAGLSFAIKVAKRFPDLSVTVVTKADDSESNTKYAQGGIAVVLDELTDSFQKHIDDTLRAGDGLCNREVVELVVREGPERLEEIIEWGVEFDQDAHGNLALGREGGHTAKRIIHYKDVTGLQIEKFSRSESQVIKRIEARIAALLNWPLELGEDMQVLHYLPGAEYKPHYDYFDPAQSSSRPILKRGGQRVGTLVMYLNTPEEGGGTVFPDAQLEVSPVRGNAVFFSYPQPHPQTRTLHGGAPVLRGEKWVATKWLRERHFN